MIEIHRDPGAPGPVVTGFSGGGFKVGATVFPGGLMLTPDSALEWNGPALDTLQAGDFAQLIDQSPQPEFLLLGTGGALARPPRALVEALEAQGVGVEAMDSRAAARAWGLLRGEGRWIVAALLPL